MSETLDNMNAEAGKRPTFLTVICILSFVGIGLSVIGYFAAFALMGVAQAAVNTAEGMGATVTDVEGPSMGALWAYIIGGFAMVILALIGVIKMWKLQKSGFYMYTIAQVVAIVLGVVASQFTVFSAVVPVAFIVMYGLNLKHMK